MRGAIRRGNDDRRVSGVGAIRTWEIRRNPRHVLLDIIGIMAVPIERGCSMSTGRGFRHGLGFSCGCASDGGG